VGGYPIRQLVLYEKYFGWMALWELNTEVLGSLWLMTSATWGGGGEGITSADCLHDWGRRAVPLWNYTVAFTLQLRKITENLSQGSRVVGDYSLYRLGRLFLWTASAGLLSVSPPRLPVGGFRQPLVGTSAFQVAELRDSPHFESKFSVRALMWSAKNGIPWQVHLNII
jgi:hypothetical protein